MPIVLLDVLTADPAPVPDVTWDVAKLAFVGVLVGAVIAAVAQVIAAALTSGRAKKARQHERLASHVTMLWAACEALRKAVDTLAHVVEEIKLGRGQHTSEEARHWEQQRQQAFVVIRETGTQADEALALLRIEFPKVAASAEGLREAAGAHSGGLEKLDERKSVYQTARTAFESAARDALKRLA